MCSLKALTCSSEPSTQVWLGNSCIHTWIDFTFINDHLMYVGATCGWSGLASGCTYDIAMGLSVSCWYCYSHTCKDNLTLEGVENLFCKHIHHINKFWGLTMDVNGCIFEALWYFSTTFLVFYTRQSTKCALSLCKNPKL